MHATLCTTTQGAATPEFDLYCVFFKSFFLRQLGLHFESGPDPTHAPIPPVPSTKESRRRGVCGSGQREEPRRGWPGRADGGAGRCRIHAYSGSACCRLSWRRSDAPALRDINFHSPTSRFARPDSSLLVPPAPPQGLCALGTVLNSADSLPNEPRAERRGGCACGQRKWGGSQPLPGRRLPGAALSSTKKAPQAPLIGWSTTLPAAARRTTAPLFLRLPSVALPSSARRSACMTLAHTEQRVPHLPLSSARAPPPPPPRDASAPRRRVLLLARSWKRACRR